MADVMERFYEEREQLKDIEIEKLKQENANLRVVIWNQVDTTRELNEYIEELEEQNKKLKTWKDGKGMAKWGL